MKNELMEKSYQQVLLDVNLIEVDLTDINKKVRFDITINKKAFITAMLDYFKTIEDYEKCHILNNKLQNL